MIKQTLLSTYGYHDVNIIKLSNFILTHYEKQCEEEVGRTPAYSRLMHKIEGGNALRKEYNNNSILVELAIKQIREDREKIDTKEIKGRRVCYIIDSLKNIEEVRLLRAVYRDIFYLFSLFSPEAERDKTLRDDYGLSGPEATEIVNTDEHEDFEYGQNVRETFVEGDFFIRSSDSNKKNIERSIQRYFHLIFESEIITPTHQETAMYYAKSASGNSSCLSRQVGATITDENGVPLVQGWNDVPKYMGNLYRDSDDKPQRCKEWGQCSNVKLKDDVFDEIISEIEKILPKEYDKSILKAQGLKQKSELAASIEKILRKSKFKNIIEYSRSIHAEMNAIYYWEPIDR